MKAEVVGVHSITSDQTGTFVGIRNSLTHVAPFDALPYAGLLELVRDLIGYMYRNFQKSP